MVVTGDGMRCGQPREKDRGDEATAGRGRAGGQRPLCRVNSPVSIRSALIMESEGTSRPPQLGAPICYMPLTVVLTGVLAAACWL